MKSSVELRFTAERLDGEGAITSASILQMRNVADDEDAVFMPIFKRESGAYMDRSGNIIKFRDVVFYRVDPETVVINAEEREP